MYYCASSSDKHQPAQHEPPRFPTSPVRTTRATLPFRTMLTLITMQLSNAMLFSRSTDKITTVCQPTQKPIVQVDMSSDSPSVVLERDEWIEQIYFFRTFRERLAEQLPAQDILQRAHEELLTTTKLPLAVQFIAAELRHTGLLQNGFAKLPHYFTPFQAFVIRQAEEDNQKFSMPTALLVLEREATFKANNPSPQGLFVYHFETIARNRLGYDAGMKAAAGDPAYDAEWRDYLDLVRRQVGTYDFSDLVYVRSELYVIDQRRKRPDYQPKRKPLFGEKEGKIAKASHGRDPLYLFSALQRQLNYPEVPRPRPKDDVNSKLEQVLVKLRDMEARLRITESELRGTFDPTKLGKPEMFRDVPDLP